MPTPEQLERGERFKEARLQTAVRLKRTVSQGLMAELVTEHLADGRTLYQSTWSEYELGVTDPPYDVATATETVSGLPREYLVFGVKPEPITIDPTRDHRLTDDEIERARVAAEAIQQERERQRKAGGSGKRRKQA